MPSVLADLSIEARWVVPMTVSGRILEHHSLVVRDGRILDLLPTSAAAARYAPTVVIERPAHLLMPGMVNAATHAARSLLRGAGAAALSLEQHFLGAEFVRDGAVAAVAEMLRSGITCFADRYFFPGETARVACEQGMRALVGLPVGDAPSPWAQTSSEYLNKALRLRDEYKDHPLISTAFAPHAPDLVSDATLARLATLADELDAGIVIDVHASGKEIAGSVNLHGARPIERLWNLGLLTPALNAVHMTLAAPADIALAERTGIAVSLCAEAALESERRLPPVAPLLRSGVRLGLATEGRGCQDLWGEIRLLALQSSPWDALAAATSGGAAAIGLDSGIGSLVAGKWADLCCIDMSGPATQPLRDPVTQLALCGGRDLVNDVWVAGRPLLSDRELTRLDWAAAADRAHLWAERLQV